MNNNAIISFTPLRCSIHEWLLMGLFLDYLIITCCSMYWYILIKAFSICMYEVLVSSLCCHNKSLHLCRSSWEKHCVPEYPIWLVHLAHNSNLRHGEGKSKLEGVHPNYLFHLQCESHKCWFGCGWRKCLYRISGGGVNSWVHLQTGQETV